MLLEKKAGAAPAYVYRRKFILQAKPVQKYMPTFLQNIFCFRRINLSLREYFCLAREPEEKIIVQAKIA